MPCSYCVVWHFETHQHPKAVPSHASHGRARRWARKLDYWVDWDHSLIVASPDTLEAHQQSCRVGVLAAQPYGLSSQSARQLCVRTGSCVLCPPADDCGCHCSPGQGSLPNCVQAQDSNSADADPHPASDGHISQHCRRGGTFSLLPHPSAFLTSSEACLADSALDNT